MLPSLLIILSCWCQADAPAQATPAKPDMAQQVARLVRQLDDDQWTRRQTAEAELIKMGPAILPLLPGGDARMSAELKERLMRVRSHLQVEYARQVVEPTRVTIQGKMSLADAIKKIEETTGNRIAGYEALAAESVTLDLQDVPFWEALDRVLDQAKLTIDPYAGQPGTLQAEPRPSEQAERFGHAYYEGPFRFEATHVTAVKNLLNPVFSGLRVRLSIAWEPKTKPISLSVPLADITARDDLGREVPADNQRGRLTAAVESDLAMIEMELPLKLPPRDAKSIELLHGSFDVMIPGRKDQFEFHDLAKGERQSQHRAGVTVTLEETRKNEDIDELIMEVAFDDATNALESYRGWILKNGAYLVDPEGKRIEYGSYRVISQDAQRVRMAYLFALDRPLADYRFVYETPSLIIREPVQFNLKNIVLP